MKKLTKLAAAVSLALLAGNASAALTTPYAGSPSSILFALDDNNTGSANVRHTFLLDLSLGHAGLNYASFANGTQGSTSWDLSQIAAFSGFAADTAALSRWSVVGGFALASDYSNFDKDGSWYGSQEAQDSSAAASFSGPAQWGALVTGHKADGADFSILDQANYDSQLSSTGKIGNWINVASSKLGANQAVDAAQFSATKSIYDNSFADIASVSAGGGTAPHTVAGNIYANGSNAADFYWLTNETGLATDAANDRIKLGTFSLAGNVLTYTVAPAVSAVPVPAAVWLFGSALLGMLGFTRRNPQAAFAA